MGEQPLSPSSAPVIHADKIAQILARDGRYHAEAYNYLANAVPLIAAEIMSHSDHKQAGRHITGGDLSRHLCSMLKQDFGRMAIDVLSLWGIHSTEDFGNIVYNLVDVGILGTSPNDSRSDFNNVFDFQKEFVAPFKTSGEMIPPPIIDFL